MLKRIKRKIKLTFFACPENNFQPDFLKPNVLFDLVVICLALKLLLFSFFAYFPNDLFFSSVVSLDLVSLLNQQRSSLGLNQLKANEQLAIAAELKARHMFEYDYFSHRGPDGVRAWDFISQTGYRYETAGENLAMGFIDSQEVHQAWNDSPLHRANLLRSDFTDIGIAAVNGNYQGQEVTIVVQLFARPQITPTVLSLTPPESEGEPGPEAVEEQAVVGITEQTVAGEKDVLTEGPSGELPRENFVDSREQEESENLNLPVVIGVLKTEEITNSGIAAKISKGLSNFWKRSYDSLSQKIIIFVGFSITSLFVVNLLVLLITPLVEKQKRKKLMARINNFKKIVPGAIVAILIIFLLGQVDRALIIEILPHKLII